MSGAQTRTRERPPIADPGRDMLQQAMEPGVEQLPALTPRVGGAATDAALAGVITAQRVAIKRHLGDVIRDVQALGQAAGADFYYRIPFKDRSGDEEKTTWVEGPSIDCAMAVAARYGNCVVRATVAAETQDSWTFVARFVDLETGFTFERAFQQRKGQNTGMKDKARQADIVFQIGQSKAIRNVIVGALPTVVNAAWEAAKNSILQRVERNPGKFQEWLGATIEEMGLSLRQVERAVGIPYDAWETNKPLMARLYADLKAVKDGMVDADELWPPIPVENKAQQPTPAAAPPAAAPAAEQPQAQQPAEPEAAPKQQRRAAPPKDDAPPPEQGDPGPPPSLDFGG